MLSSVFAVSVRKIVAASFVDSLASPKSSKHTLRLADRNKRTSQQGSPCNTQSPCCQLLCSVECCQSLLYALSSNAWRQSKHVRIPTCCPDRWQLPMLLLSSQRMKSISKRRMSIFPCWATLLETK
ncbi:hypothetical protein KP509_05G072200 [Ceratopteris richardii]|uniref:Uncharacterized protein n=1 Tax=Ceratopteris richardii TaxID=49495 RepID=A0A8T2UPX9_CERRI|nr:hypothetical protein KP509_05G072200 [Ceratopteris richardii]